MDTNSQAEIKLKNFQKASDYYSNHPPSAPFDPPGYQSQSWERVMNERVGDNSNFNDFNDFNGARGVRARASGYGGDERERAWGQGGGRRRREIEMERERRERELDGLCEEAISVLDENVRLLQELIKVNNLGLLGLFG